jgi:hypothetical protein
VFSSAMQRKFWKCEQKHCIWQRKNLNSKALYFVQQRSEKLWNVISSCGANKVRLLSIQRLIERDINQCGLYSTTTI